MEMLQGKLKIHIVIETGPSRMGRGLGLSLIRASKNLYSALNIGFLQGVLAVHGGETTGFWLGL